MTVTEFNYPTQVFWSEEDEGYIAIAPDLPSCSAWGSTEAEAKAELNSAIQAWIMAAKKIGREIPKIAA